MARLEIVSVAHLGRGDYAVRRVWASLIFISLLGFAADPARAAEAAADDFSSFAGQPVARIVFETRLNLSDAELLSTLPLRPGRVLGKNDVERSVESLMRRGIFSSVESRIEHAADGLNIWFVLTPALHISELGFRGNGALSDSKLRGVVRVSVGERLRYDLLDRAKSRIEESYRKAGYYRARVDTEINLSLQAPWADVVFVIEEGSATLIDGISFRGAVSSEMSLCIEPMLSATRGTVASGDNIKQFRRDLLKVLRRRGYLGSAISRVEQSYDELQNRVSLYLSLHSGERASLAFIGNKSFSSKVLRTALGVETRMAGITEANLPGLCLDVKEFYQSYGYASVSANCRRVIGKENRLRYEVEIEEGDQVRIRRISLRGNGAFSDGELRQLMASGKAGWWLFRRWLPGYLVEAELQSDTARIREFYQSRGFVDVEVRSELQREEGESYVDVLISIEEGAKREIVSLSLVGMGEGIAALPGLEGLALKLSPGDPLDEQLISVERRRLLREVVQAGYPNAEVIARSEKAEGKLEFIVDAGRRTEVGQVWFQGNIFTHDQIIARELNFSSGDIWDAESIRRAESSLYRLGIFNTVSLQPLDGSLDDAVEDIAVKVTERETGVLDLGAAFDTEDGLNVSGEVGQRNLAGEGESLVLGIDGYFRSGQRLFDAGNITTTYTKPRIFDSQMDLLLEGFGRYSIQLVDQFSYDRLGGSATLRRDFESGLEIRGGISGFNEQIYDVDPDTVLAPHDSGSTNYAFYNGEISLDRRDNAYNPKKGFRTSLQGKMTSQALGSEVNFAGLSLQQSVFVSLHQRLVWANSARFQSLWPFADTEVVPLSQRIFLGGRNSLRGFARNTVGPRAASGDVVGGDSSLVLNSELQFEMWPNVVSVLFLDAGQAFLRDKGTFDGEDLGISDLRYSPGFGLRYLTPVGPVSAEYGIALNRKEGESSGRFNLSIGGAF